jgi:dihydrodipicolinate synthase/N-acetylneuraminate lyase
MDCTRVQTDGLQAKDLGCDGVLSVIPYYNKPTQVPHDLTLVMALAADP